MPSGSTSDENTNEYLDDNPALSNVVERNIRTIVDIRLQASHARTLQERLADLVTDASGRMRFVYVHVVWFGLWFVVNSGWVGIQPFDPFPYGLLTMIVSLEAIFLAAFVLISQNRMSAESEHRADLALHIGLLTEHELTRALQMLDAIQKKLDVVSDANQELADLEMETRPEDVLAEIARIQKRAVARDRPTSA